MDQNLEVQLVKPVAGLVTGRLNVELRVPVAVLYQRDMPEPLVTTFQACTLPCKDRLHEFGSHLFVSNADGPGETYHTFKFVEVRTPAQIATAVPSLSYPDTQPHHWRDCLIELGAIEDASEPLNFESGGQTIEVPRLFGRMHLLPGGMYASEIEVETFVAHRPFTREEMGVLESQVTTRIHWQGRNLDINLDCLHGLVEFPETQTQGRVLGGFGTVDRPLQMTGKTVFPPTPMPKWKKYLFDQRHERVGEEWRLTNYWVNPPRGARHILGAAV